MHNFVFSLDNLDHSLYNLLATTIQKQLEPPARRRIKRTQRLQSRPFLQNLRRNTDKYLNGDEV